MTDSVWPQILRILVCDQNKTFLFCDIMFKSGYFQIFGRFFSFSFSDLQQSGIKKQAINLKISTFEHDVIKQKSLILVTNLYIQSLKQNRVGQNWPIFWPLSKE